MKEYSWKNKKPILAHNVLYAVTSEQDYEMSRLIILEEDCKYIILEGSHCSCYDFDEITWYAIEFENLEEMKKYLNVADYEKLRRKAFNFMNYYSDEFNTIKIETKF